MKANKGFTLIEIAVVLAIIAILAAIMTPIVTSYIDQARITRAAGDTKKLAEAVLLYKRDTGFFPVYDTLAHAQAGSAPDNLCLITGTSKTVTLTGTALTYCTSVGLVEQYLNVNSIGLVGTNNSPSGTGGLIAFRGPYLDNLVGVDPWGNPYLISSGLLTVAAADHAFAASAGPNQSFETTFNQGMTGPAAGGGGFAAGGDDLVAQIR